MSVFISYSSQDKEFAQRLAGDLKNHGITVWFDETELLPGDSIIGTIEAVIDQMAFLIVVLSPRSVVSEWVTQEVRMALHNGISGKKVSVIPVLRETCQIPGFLRDLKYADMRSDPDYPASLEKLVAKINRRLEFKDDLQKLQGDLAFVKESREAAQDKLGPEKSHGIEQLISLVRRAISLRCLHFIQSCCRWKSGPCASQRSPPTRETIF